MSTDEVSRRRFRWLAAQREFTLWEEERIAEVLPLCVTVPDFLAQTKAATRFLVEMKSFEHDTILRRVTSRVIALDHMELQKRINRAVADAAQQLRPYAATGLPLVVALDNWRQVGLSLDSHSLRSLLGEAHVVLTVDTTTGESVSESVERKDDNSPLAEGRNSHVSAVMVVVPVVRFDTTDEADDFSVERLMRVRVFRNPTAAVPLPADVFSHPDDENLS